MMQPEPPPAPSAPEPIVPTMPPELPRLLQGLWLALGEARQAEHDTDAEEQAWMRINRYERSIKDVMRRNQTAAGGESHGIK